LMRENIRAKRVNNDSMMEIVRRERVENDNAEKDV